MARKSGLGFFGVARQSARRNHQAFNASLGQVIPAREHPHLMEQAAEERAARPAPKSHSSHRHSGPRYSASLGETRPVDENFSRGM